LGLFLGGDHPPGLVDGKRSFYGYVCNSSNRTLQYVGLVNTCLHHSLLIKSDRNYKKKTSTLQTFTVLVQVSPMYFSCFPLKKPFDVILFCKNYFFAVIFNANLIGIAARNKYTGKTCDFNSQIVCSV